MFSFNFADFNDLNIGASVFLLMFIGAFGYAFLAHEKNEKPLKPSIDASLMFSKDDMKKLQKLRKEIEKELKNIKNLHENLKDVEAKKNSKTSSK